MKDRSSDPILLSRGYRRVTVLMGLFFMGLAATVLVLADDETLLGSAVAALVLVLLGLDAVVSALRGRRSLLSRIGALP
ncbi:MAG: hypothetical protein KKC79_20750 [Gammaproteobacteria bacterium]|nr:hypothetical protein [Gammaproteobacteria bacterium]MBU1440269.1 hypothetical protein [Gammaproteobacteria bacterium]MBU2288366.1 hypothetical protein [Gammaproteobacteria bacterium]MBU2411066.1 hypothetical protein [Gammaproteobacteria bacterium]